MFDWSGKNGDKSGKGQGKVREFWYLVWVATLLWGHCNPHAREVSSELFCEWISVTPQAQLATITCSYFCCKWDFIKFFFTYASSYCLILHFYCEMILIVLLLKGKENGKTIMLSSITYTWYYWFMCMHWLKYCMLNKIDRLKNMRAMTLEVAMLADVRGAYSAISSVNLCVTGTL